MLQRGDNIIVAAFETHEQFDKFAQRLQLFGVGVGVKALQGGGDVCVYLVFGVELVYNKRDGDEGDEVGCEFFEKAALGAWCRQ